MLGERQGYKKELGLSEKEIDARVKAKIVRDNKIKEGTKTETFKLEAPVTIKPRTKK